MSLVRRPQDRRQDRGREPKAGAAPLIFYIIAVRSRKQLILYSYHTCSFICRPGAESRRRAHRSSLRCYITL